MVLSTQHSLPNPACEQEHLQDLILPRGWVYRRLPPLVRRWWNKDNLAPGSSHNFIVLARSRTINYCSKTLCSARAAAQRSLCSPRERCPCVSAGSGAAGHTGGTRVRAMQREEQRRGLCGAAEKCQAAAPARPRRSWEAAGSSQAISCLLREGEAFTFSPWPNAYGETALAGRACQILAARGWRPPGCPATL